MEGAGKKWKSVVLTIKVH